MQIKILIQVFETKIQEMNYNKYYYSWRRKFFNQMFEWI